MRGDCLLRKHDHTLSLYTEDIIESVRTQLELFRKPGEVHSSIWVQDREGC